MANFSKNVQDATETELLLWVNNFDPRFVSLASDELTRRSIKKLNESIDRETAQSKESSDMSEKFTLALFLLSIAQLLVAIFQFIFSFAYSENTQGKIFGIVMIVITGTVLAYFSRRIFGKRKDRPLKFNSD